MLPSSCRTWCSPRCQLPLRAPSKSALKEDPDLRQASVFPSAAVSNHMREQPPPEGRTYRRLSHARFAACPGTSVVAPFLVRPEAGSMAGDISPTMTKRAVNILSRHDMWPTPSCDKASSACAAEILTP